MEQPLSGAHQKNGDIEAVGKQRINLAAPICLHGFAIERGTAPAFIDRALRALSQVQNLGLAGPERPLIAVRLDYIEHSQKYYERKHGRHISFISPA